MDAMKPAKRGRGPGKKPRQGITSVRVPVYVLNFYRKNFDNSTAKMREVLVEYAISQGANDGKAEAEKQG
jgi:hypothetical protein